MRGIKKQGFTLTEIMIIVAILGLLAVMGIPYILNAYSSSLQKTKNRNIAEVEKAKGVLSLPVSSGLPGAMSLDDTSLEIAEDDVGLLSLCSALSIRHLDELTVGSDSIAVGSLSTKASYGSSE
ncbi:MAG: prepilin-type N-terminal cleavage/methylation domain-containing protein [Kiritimatiellales bacterium]|nr:prepilin-type N-terminal cleavage/methylation domain-containing protein [Kiritimatiellota bacterium]MBL7012385.1 prepilin-type N-terminal cleavage/methylation domain-containing protein [Kiritimatiellales bacterium]